MRSKLSDQRCPRQRVFVFNPTTPCSSERFRLFESKRRRERALLPNFRIEHLWQMRAIEARCRFQRRVLLSSNAPGTGCKPRKTKPYCTIRDHLSSGGCRQNLAGDIYATDFGDVADFRFGAVERVLAIFGHLRMRKYLVRVFDISENVAHWQRPTSKQRGE